MPETTAEHYLDAIAPTVALIDEWLGEALMSADLPGNLRQAAGHALLVGGKRLRPLLSVLCCEAAGGSTCDAAPAAAAIELVHAFSLVHDDLPALDNDLMRRGHPTVHVRFGEAMAVLAGDALMSLAFEVAARPPAPRGLVEELATATTRMISGQVLDTLGGFESSERDPLHRLRRIHENKTGALITAACRMGALCGLSEGGAAPDGEAPAESRTGGVAPAEGGREEFRRSVLDAVTTYGEAIGLMFQIVDDLLDVTQSAEHLGKGVGKDESAGKLTFPLVLGVDASRDEVRRLHQEALAALAPLGERGRPLAELADFMAVRTR